MSAATYVEGSKNHKISGEEKVDATSKMNDKDIMAMATAFESAVKDNISAIQTFLELGEIIHPDGSLIFPNKVIEDNFKSNWKKLYSVLLSSSEKLLEVQEFLECQNEDQG